MSQSSRLPATKKKIVRASSSMAVQLCWPPRQHPFEMGRLTNVRVTNGVLFRGGFNPAHSTRLLMWYLLQVSIIFAVIASNIHWKWTPNGYLPAVLGAGLHGC